MAEGPLWWIEVTNIRCNSASSFGAITVKLGMARK